MEARPYCKARQPWRDRVAAAARAAAARAAAARAAAAGSNGCSANVLSTHTSHSVPIILVGAIH